MPTNFPAPLTPAQLDELFPKERTKPIKDGAFEVGLVLGGTVSAGAYTGGVLDFLIEALDAWTKAKEEDRPEAPRHEVVISTIAGTSGGGINGAMLLRAASFGFTHGPTDANPFYNAWNKGVDLLRLLSADPEKDVAGFGSVLNCTAIDQQAQHTIEYIGPQLGVGGSPARRSYFADPLRHFMMIGNVTGIPYKIALKGQTGLAHEMIAHADYERFALTVPGGVPALPGSRPDEFALSANSPINWDRIKGAALATSAFPMALRARALNRPLEVFGYRFAVVPNDTGPADVVQLIPKWEALTGDKPPPWVVPFVNVDGGTVNNEPLDVVRMALAGYAGRNDRDGATADRAVVLVDPFTDPEALGPSAVPSALQLLFPFIMALVFQSRFKPVDLALATADNVYSRFLVAPMRPGSDPAKPIVGYKAIASGGLGGFLGFLDARFTDYDFRLGRRNAYEFLKSEFALPENNPLFQAPNWTPKHRQDYATMYQGKKYLQLIPLMPNLPEPPMPSPWPVLDRMPDWLSDAIDKRLDVIYSSVLDGLASASWLMRQVISAYAWAGWKAGGRSFLRDKALSAIEEALKSQGLLRQ